MQINITNPVTDATYGYRQECLDESGMQSSFTLRQKNLNVLSCEYQLNSPAELVLSFDLPTLVFCLGHPVQVIADGDAGPSLATNEMVVLLKTVQLRKISLQKFKSYSLLFITGQLKMANGTDINSLILKQLQKDAGGKFEHSKRVKISDAEASLIQKLKEVKTIDAGNGLVILHVKELYKMALAAFRKESTHSNHSEVIQKAKSYILENLHLCHDLSAYCKDAGLTTDLHYKMFLEMYGISANEFVQHARVEKVKKLLGTANHTCFISKTVGFEDQNEFLSFFQNQTGQTPGEYKKSKIRQ